ncbi:MAG: hypothetical protein JNL82_25835 [Myxococcales bacterium]|jgi:hypothetical protein|nr:hypothetical protein [Myxococcales bacterium]
MPRPTAPLSLSLVLALAACPAGDSKKVVETKKTPDAKTEPAGDATQDQNTSLSKAVTTIDTAGPVPPEVSAVLFTVDGALIPIGCFIKGKKLASGKDCLSVVKKDDEVYLKAKSVEKLDKIGDPKSANCEVGGGAATSLSTPSTDTGATFDYAVAPKSLARVLTPMPEDSWSDRKPSLSAEETAALVGLSKVTGALTIGQNASHDVDGDGTPDKIVTAFQIDAKDSERYSFSGIFLQRGNAPGKWAVLLSDKSDVKSYTVRAAVDLDGDRTAELWVNSVGTDGSGGDALFQLSGDTAKPVGKFSCGG